MGFIETNTTQEQCILIGIQLPNQDKWQVKDHLEELASLANTAGAEVHEIIIQERNKPDSAYFIGKGKAEEIATIIEMEKIDLLIFDDELSPAQVRNLENLTKIKVIDRAGLILDIFAAHARTRESKTQVELAQLKYLLPRLTRQWTHLSRQVGGIGTKGPGETQLETDRRLVRTRISFLNKDLKIIEKQRESQRKQQKDFHRIALVGYTNAGKSTLMNALTDSKVLVENKLFATLDTTTRKFDLKANMQILISDTVGFIRKLPHDLVASFKSTLAQAIEADILIHLVDLSHAAFKEHIDTVNNLLKELEINEKPLILVFNKVDKIKESDYFASIQQKYNDAIFISAKKNMRLGRLNKKILNILEKGYIDKDFELSYEKSHLVPKIRNLGEVLNQDYSENNISLKVRVKKENEYKLENILNG
jgi:GTP-binding protein HflX